MKILMVADSIMLHLERDEAIALVNILTLDKSKIRSSPQEHSNLISEIVRQIDICLNAGKD